MRTLLATCAVLATATTAFAQPSATTAAPTTKVYVYNIEDPHRSEGAGWLLAIGTTVVGAAIAAKGSDEGNDFVMIGGTALAFVGPSAGHLYAGCYEHALVMTGVRLGALAFVAAALYQDDKDDDADNGSPDYERMAIGGVVVIGASAVFDMIDAGFAVRRYNRGIDAHLMPAPIGTATGVAPGVMLGGHF